MGINILYGLNIVPVGVWVGEGLPVGVRVPEGVVVSVTVAGIQAPKLP